MTKKRYWVGVAQDNDRTPIGNEGIIGNDKGMTGDEVLAAIATWRQQGNNLMRPIEITDELGRVIVDESGNIRSQS